MTSCFRFDPCRRIFLFLQLPLHPDRDHYCCQYNQVIVNSLLITTGTLLPQGILRDYYTDTTGDKNIINYNILLLRILLTTIRKLLVSISREYYRNFILVLRYCIYMVSVTDIVGFLFGPC